jgi:hypothetical protein
MDNLASKPIRGPGPSGWVGVSLEKRSGRWVAVMRVGGVFYRIGAFPTAEGAACARAEALAKALASTATTEQAGEANA